MGDSSHSPLYNTLMNRALRFDNHHMLHCPDLSDYISVSKQAERWVPRHEHQNCGLASDRTKGGTKELLM